MADAEEPLEELDLPLEGASRAALEAAALLGHEPAREALGWVRRSPDLFRAHRGLDGLGRVARVEGARVAATYLLEVHHGYPVGAEATREARAHRAAARAGIDPGRLRLPPLEGSRSVWASYTIPSPVWLARVLEAALLHRADPRAGRQAMAEVPACNYGSTTLDAVRPLIRAVRVRDEAESFGASWACLRQVRDALASYRVSAQGERWAEARLVDVLRGRLLPWLLVGAEGRSG